MQSHPGEGLRRKAGGIIGDSFFYRPLFLSLTIGVPFCLYKILFGVLCVRSAEITGGTGVVSGCLLIAWAGTDMLMNLTRAGLDIIGEGDRMEFCVLAQAGRYLGIPAVFLAADTLITFSIICTTLWSGWIGSLTGIESQIWNFATTLNLISLSLVSLWTEIQRVIPGRVSRE